MLADRHSPARGAIRNRSVFRRGWDWARRARLQYVLNGWSRTHPEVTFLQIGSHNGQANDPISRHLDRNPGWHGIMVEPVPHLFEELHARRGSDARFELVRAAVTDRPGTVKMTTVDWTSRMPKWADQLSSLDPQVILKHEPEIPGLHDRLCTIEVPAVTFDQLANQLSALDLLHIDAEGHDAVILAQIDFRRWRPSVVLFEHKHLTTDAWARCRSQLAAHGYRLTWSNADTLAIKPRERARQAQ